MRVPNHPNHAPSSRAPTSAPTTTQSSSQPVTGRQVGPYRKVYFAIEQDDPVAARYLQVEQEIWEFIQAKVPSCRTAFILNTGTSIQTARPTLSLSVHSGQMTEEQKERAIGLLREKLALHELSRLDVEITEGMFWW